MSPYRICRQQTPNGPRWILYRRRPGRDLIALLFPLEEVARRHTHAQAVTRLNLELRRARHRPAYTLGVPGRLTPPLIPGDALQKSTYTLAPYVEHLDA